MGSCVALFIVCQSGRRLGRLQHNAASLWRTPQHKDQSSDTGPEHRGGLSACVWAAAARPHAFTATPVHAQQSDRQSLPEASTHQPQIPYVGRTRRKKQSKRACISFKSLFYFSSVKKKKKLDSVSWKGGGRELHSSDLHLKSASICSVFHRNSTNWQVQLMQQRGKSE